MVPEWSLSNIPAEQKHISMSVHYDKNTCDQHFVYLDI